MESQDQQPIPETITFKDGKFHSSACDAYKFGDGNYSAKSQKDGSITFKAETRNPDGSKIKWEGTIKDNKLEASANMIQKGKQPMLSTVKASLK